MEVGLSLVSLWILQSWGVEHPGAVVCPICLPVLLDVPVSNKNLPDTSSSPPPCSFSLEEQIFTVILGRRKSF